MVEASLLSRPGVRCLGADMLSPARASARAGRSTLRNQTFDQPPVLDVEAAAIDVRHHEVRAQYLRLRSAIGSYSQG